MLDTKLTDGLGGKNRAEITSNHALRVAIENYHTYAAAGVLFTNPTYGFDMNKNFSNVAGGNANEDVHNGTDTDEWTASAVLGTWDFASTTNPDSGTKNIEMIAGSIGDTALIDRGSDVTMSAHTGFTGRIYITSVGQNDTAQLTFYAWDTVSGTIVGNAVDVYDYVATGSLLVYQTFTIPLVDMGLTGATFDSVRFTITTKPGGTFDLDNIILTDPTGGAAIGTTLYTMKPPRGSRWLLNGFTVNMAAALTGTVENGTMPGLSYNKLLSVTELSSPIIYQVYYQDEVTFVAPFAKLVDFFIFGEPNLKVAASDGTNTWITIYIGLDSPIVLNGDQADRITLTLSDDLSGLLYFRFSANASQQNLPEARA